METMTNENIDDNKKQSYPKYIFFIVGNEFCERFSFYGMRTILALYLRMQLKYSENSAVVIYHVFNTLCYFMPIIGSIIADSILGKYKTIFYISIVYALGNVIISFSATPFSGLTQIPLVFVGLFLIAFGTGGIKSCVVAFGGDQFKLPEQEKQLNSFFFLFYFAINAGSLLSTFITPMLRQDIKCLGMNTCYPLAFGIPAILFIVALVLFVLGRPFYKINLPKGNITIDVTCCLWYALKKKFTSKKKEKSWLMNASDKYELNFIRDIQRLLRVLILFIPVPIFWALYEQQGSRWTFQATRLNGYVTEDFYIKPDQMQVINPIFILIFIPMFQYVFYPLCAKCNILTTSIQRLVTGGIVASLAFVISGVLQTQIEDETPPLPEYGTSSCTFINGVNCSFKVEVDNISQIISPYSRVIYKTVHLPKNTSEMQISIPVQPIHCDITNEIQNVTTILHNRKVTSLLLTDSIKTGKIIECEEDPRKSSTGLPKLKIYYEFKNMENQSIEIILRPKYGVEVTFSISSENGVTEYKDIDIQRYQFIVKNQQSERFVGEFVADLGMVSHFLILIDENGEEIFEELIVTKPNSIHLLWQIPQLILITCAEILFSITGIEFSFKQAPHSMKSVIMAVWDFTTCLGNILVIIVAESSIFEKQSFENFFYAGLIVLDIIALGILGKCYFSDESYYEEEVHRSSMAVDNGFTESKNLTFVLEEQQNFNLNSVHTQNKLPGIEKITKF